MENKPGSLRLYISGVASKRPFSFIGLLFIIIGLVVMPLILNYLNNKLRQPYEKYEYEKIVATGYTQHAKITWIEREVNTRINGVNPRVISYTYTTNGNTVVDKFQTLDVEKLETLRVADSIDISVLNNQSVINNIRPFTFPFEYLWLSVLIFIFLGWMMYSSGHKAGINNIKAQRQGNYL